MLRKRTRSRKLRKSRSPDQSRGQQKSAGEPALFEMMYGDAAYWIVLPPPPCSAIRELNGESPCFGSSTTTMVPVLTRLYRSMTSSLVIRMQPGERDAPIYSGWLVP